MKKLIFSVLMGACMAAGLSAKTAVVYFSATGTTERMAKNVVSAMGADIFEIEPVHKYTAADLNWLIEDDTAANAVLLQQHGIPERIGSA